MTRYKALERVGEYTLVECELVTGRTHQIRVHLASIGHPIVGDEKYGDFQDCRKMKKLHGLENQFLHAYKLGFGQLSGILSPLSGKEFVCPLPKDESDLIASLKSE